MDISVKNIKFYEKRGVVLNSEEKVYGKMFSGKLNKK